MLSFYNIIKSVIHRSCTKYGRMIAKPFVLLCLNLSISAYTTNFSFFGSYQLHRKEISKVFEPSYYIFRDYSSDTLYVVVRGSQQIEDFYTVMNDHEIQTEYGLFHSGVFFSAVFIKDAVETYIKPNDKIVLTGHSYGGSVSSVLSIILKKDHSDCQIKAVGFGSLPCIGTETMKRSNANSIISTFVYKNDFFPTFSIENVFQFAESVDESRILHKFRGLLNSFNTTNLPAGDFILSSLKIMAPQVSSNAKYFGNGIIRKVRFAPGTIYHIGNCFSFEECKEDESQTNKLSTDINSLWDHALYSYIKGIRDLE